MNPAKVQKVLVVMLAVTSACTLTLIALNVVRTHARTDPGARPNSVARAHTQAADPAGDAPILHVETLGIEPERDEPPRVLFDAPAFALTERSGQTLDSAALAGKVWIADFVFTRCGSICPRMSAAMAELQGKLQARADWPDIRLVSFSVDPEHDTPEVLREYARTYHAHESQWLFLTGQRKAIWPLVKDGFKLPVGENSPEDATSPILHSGKFVLVDGQGKIRGYYDGMESKGRARLLADVGRVMAEAKTPPATQP